MNETAVTKQHYGALARWLHWSMAMLIIGMVFVGAAMTNSVAVWQPTVVQLHKWLGLSLLVLVVLRLIYRLRHRAPALPSDLPKLQALAARGAHVALYTLMFAMPLVGWAMQGAAGTPVMLPGGWVLPALVGRDLDTYGVLRDLHTLFGYGLFALVLMHAGAGLYHGLLRRDGVLDSMLHGAPHSPAAAPIIGAVDDSIVEPQSPALPSDDRPVDTPPVTPGRLELSAANSAVDHSAEIRKR